MKFVFSLSSFSSLNVFESVAKSCACRSLDNGNQRYFAAEDGEDRGRRNQSRYTSSWIIYWGHRTRTEDIRRHWPRGEEDTCGGSDPRHEANHAGHCQGRCRRQLWSPGGCYRSSQHGPESHLRFAEDLQGQGHWSRVNSADVKKLVMISASLAVLVMENISGHLLLLIWRNLIGRVQGAAANADSAELQQQVLDSGRLCSIAYKELLEQVGQVIQKQTPDGKQRLLLLSKKVAQSVTELVHAAEILKGQWLWHYCADCGQFNFCCCCSLYLVSTEWLRMFSN